MTLFNANFTKKISLTCIICTLTLIITGCAGNTWDIYSEADYSDRHLSINNNNNNNNKPAIIEHHKDRNSPLIRTFTHYELGIYKRNTASDWNALGASNKIITPAGKIQLGILNAWPYTKSIEFTAQPEHHYTITNICIPYPYVVIVESNKSRIIAVESYCPFCDSLINTKLSPFTECIDFPTLHPKWIEKSDVSFWDGKLDEWYYEDYLDQLYRNLCYGAEKNLPSAVRALARNYYIGRYRSISAPEDTAENHIRAYAWHLIAESFSESPQDFHERNDYGWMMARLKDELSLAQLKEALEYAKNRKVGQCEEDLVDSRKPKYEIKLSD